MATLRAFLARPWDARAPHATSTGFGAIAAAIAVVLLAAFALQPLAITGAALALLVLFGVIVSAVRRPDRTLAAAFFLVPMAATKFRMRDPTMATSGSVDVQILYELAMYGLLFGIVAIARFSTFYRSEPVRWPEWSLTVFVGFLAVSAFWSPVTTLALVRSVQAAILLACCLTAVRVLGAERTVHAIFGSLLVYILIAAPVGTVLPGMDGMIAASSEDIRHGVGRFAWFAMHPIWVATFCSCAAVYVTSRLVADRTTAGGGRARAWIALGVLALIILATRSRGPSVACAVAVVMVWLRYWVSGRLQWLVAGTGIGIAAFALAVGVSPADWLRSPEVANTDAARYVLRGQTPEELLAFSGRGELWAATVDLIGDRPVLGHGYLSSRELFVDLISWGTSGGYAHNALLQSLLDVGVVGALLLWVPLLSALFTGSIAGTRWEDGPAAAARLAVTGVVLFLMVNAIGSESFAAAPGPELLLAFAAPIVAVRFRTSAGPAPATLTDR